MIGIIDLKKVRESLKKAVKNGFFHILAGNTMVKIISALSALLLPNIVPKSQYGAFSVPDNFISMVLLFNGLGVSTAVLRYCAVFDAPSEKKAYFRFCIRFGVAFDMLLIVIASVVLYFLNRYHFYRITAFEMRLLMGLALTPVLAFLFDAIQNYLRATRQNQLYSKLSVLYTLGFALFQIGFVLIFQIYGVIPGRYLAYILSIAVGLLMLRSRSPFRVKPLKLRRFEKIGMVKYAFNWMLANCFSLMMPLVETMIVNKFVLDNILRANFKNSSLAPQSIQFVTLSVIVFAFPYFAKNSKDGKWIYNQAKKMYIGLTASMAVVIPLCILFTPTLLNVFWHNYYNAQTVHLMRIFWVTFGINAALRMPTGNILAAIGEIKFNLFNAVIASVLQAGLCWVLVKNYQLNGAAYGLLAAYAVSAAVGMLYLGYYCKGLEKKQQKLSAQSIQEREI